MLQLLRSFENLFTKTKNMENETIEHPATTGAISFESTNTNYPNYFKCEATNTVVKQESELKLKYVQVVKFDTGSFRHHRGVTCYPNTDRLNDFLQEKNLVPGTEADFIGMLKNYFAIDKKVREGFIRNIDEKEYLKLNI